MSSFSPDRLTDTTLLTEVPPMVSLEHGSRMEENADVVDSEPDEDDMAAFAALDDPAFPPIFDHYDPTTVQWLLGEIVKKQQLGGGTLY